MAYIIYVDDIQEVLQHEISFSVQHGTKVKHIIVLKRKNTETYIEVEEADLPKKIIIDGIF